MEKEIASTIVGQRADIGDFKIYRIVGNRQVRAVGPIVFLDHAAPMEKTPKKHPVLLNGTGAHPHRGIATFGYVISGEIEHSDSRGNHGIVGPGGAQWMKAGNGIIHDEGMSAHFQATGGTMHMLQFWVNLPAKNKTDEPAYKKLQTHEIPEISLADGEAKLRVLIGDYQGIVSEIETYSPQFIYELQLQPGTEYKVELQPDWESAVYITDGEADIAGAKINTGTLAVLKTGGEFIRLKNEGTALARTFIFGGAHYGEPILSEGPFVMNNQAEIAQAYSDYHTGKYGKINYHQFQ
jgi:redox-sensitive bicupin YhaK (pirin superfamily)